MRSSARRRAVRRSRRARRGEVRRRRPDGPSLADHRRPARRGRGQGRAEARATGERARGDARTQTRSRAHRAERLMFGPFERAVAGRYLRARKGERFVSIIAIFSLVGIALGRRHADRRHQRDERLPDRARCRRILGLNGHITVEAYAGEKIDDYQPLLTGIRAMPGVVSATAGAGRPGAADHRSRRRARRSGARHDAGRSARAASGQRPYRGRQARRFHRRRCDRRSASAWRSAYRLRIGDPLTLISPQGAATAFGTMPRVRAYKVVAIFDAGLNDYNNSVVFLPLPAAQMFFQKPDAVTGIEIRAADPDQRGRRCCRRCAQVLARPPGAGCATGGTPTTPSSACCRCRRTRCSSSSA